MSGSHCAENKDYSLTLIVGITDLTACRQSYLGFYVRDLQRLVKSIENLLESNCHLTDTKTELYH